MSGERLYPKSSGSTLVLYDLRDVAAWASARRSRATWGRQHSVIHTLDNDRIVIEYMPGGALDAVAS